MDTTLVACKDCGKMIDEIAVFPRGRCVECHAAIWDKVPVHQLPKPEFGRASIARTKKR
jgi:hypothetical protein